MCPASDRRQLGGQWAVFNFLTCCPLLCSGTSNGSVLVYNLTSGLLHKELSVHSCEVRWASWSPTRSVCWIEIVCHCLCHKPSSSKVITWSCECRHVRWTPVFSFKSVGRWHRQVACHMMNEETDSCLPNVILSCGVWMRERQVRDTLLRFHGGCRGDLRVVGPAGCQRVLSGSHVSKRVWVTWVIQNWRLHVD